jgi:predicted metal-dependent phosphoesterase TrpH
MQEDKRFVDLHMHSTASDGSYTPTELLTQANSINLAAIALTDHDTLSGLPEFLKEAENYPNLTAVPGIEVSAEYCGKEIHILGLFVDINDKPLEEMLFEIRKNRNDRNKLIIDKLQGMGYEITLQEVLNLAGGESVGRPIFAKILVDKGYFSEPQAVFDHCLKRGAPAYCSRILPTPKKAIEKIKQSGGIAVWAHPLYRTQADRNYLRKVLKEMISYGLDAVEAHYSSFTQSQVKAVMEVAYEFSIPVSGGSDFHGTNQIGIEMGRGRGNLEVPYSVFENLHALHNKQQLTRRL